MEALEEAHAELSANRLSAQTATAAWAEERSALLERIARLREAAASRDALGQAPAYLPERSQSATVEADAEMEALRGSNHSLQRKLEAALGRVAQLQRALAAAASHTAAAQHRWETEREQLIAQGEADLRALSATLAPKAAPVQQREGLDSPSPDGGLSDAERRRMQLEADVRQAIAAKQSADAARRLAASEADRRRLAAENEALRRAAQDSGVLALLGISDADVKSALACAPSGALGDVVSSGQRLGLLLEQAVLDGVAQLSVVGASLAVPQLGGLAESLAATAGMAAEDRDERPRHQRERRAAASGY
jgi:hypothetical protein